MPSRIQAALEKKQRRAARVKAKARTPGHHPYLWVGGSALSLLAANSGS